LVELKLILKKLPLLITKTKESVPDLCLSLTAPHQTIINSSVFQKYIKKTLQSSISRVFLLLVNDIKKIKLDLFKINKIKENDNSYYKKEKIKLKYEKLINLNEKRLKYYERKAE